VRRALLDDRKFSHVGSNSSGHGTFLINPKALAQCSFQDFAGAALRQLGIRQFNATWNLVIGERSTTMSDQFILAQSPYRFPHDASCREFAPLWIRYSKRLLLHKPLDAGR